MCKTFLKLARMIVQAAEEAEAKRVQQERVDAVRERFRKGVKKQLKASAAEAAADKVEAEEEAVAAELERIRVEQEEASGVHQLKEAGFTAVEAVPSPATKKGELAAGSDDGASPTNGKQLWAKVGQNGRVTAKIDIFSSPKSETGASPNRELPVHSPTRNSPKKEKKDKKDKKRKKRRKKQKNGAADKYEVEVDDGEAEAEVVSPALAKQLRKNGIQNQLRKNGSPLTGLSPVAVGTVRGKARARKGSGHRSPQRSNGHDDGAHPFAVDADEDEGQADGGWDGEEQHEEEEEEEEEPEPEQVWSSSSDEEPEPVFVRELVVALP